MEVRFAVFEYINYRVCVPKNEGIYATEAFGKFADFIKARCQAFNEHPRLEVNLIITSTLAVLWTTSRHIEADQRFMRLCDDVMKESFFCYVPSRGYIDYLVVDGKNWLDPSFFHERYTIDWSAEIRAALTVLKFMPLCALQVSKAAVEATRGEYFITNVNGETKCHNSQLLEYQLNPSAPKLTLVKWPRWYMHSEEIKKLFRLNFNPQPDEFCQEIITNTDNFMRFSISLEQ